MKNDPNDRHLDQTDEEILTSDVSDEALEVAAGMGGTGPTASINIVPPNCCCRRWPLSEPGAWIYPYLGEARCQPRVARNGAMMAAETHQRPRQSQHGPSTSDATASAAWRSSPPTGKPRPW